MSGLQPDERRLLDDYVAARTPDITRALAATMQRIEHGPAPVLPDLPPAASAWPRVAIFAIAAAAIVILGWRAFDTLERSRGDAPQSAPMIANDEPSGGDVPAPPRTEPADTRTTVVEDAPQGDPPPSEVIEPEVATKQESRPTKRRSSPSLAEELALLRDADAALDAGNAKKALALLDQHAREYPRGQMVPERLLQKAIALCKLGKREKSRAQVDKLLRAYPTTPLRARASDVCKADAQ